MVEGGFEPKGISTLCLWSCVRRQQSRVAAAPPTCSHKRYVQLPPCGSTQPALLTARCRHFTKQQGSRHQHGFFSSLLAASSLFVLFFFFFFKKHNDTCIDIILVFYGLKMTHSRGGVSCALCHTANRKSLPLGVFTPPALCPPPHKHTTTSRVTGVLAVDTISTATTSCDPQLLP